MPLIPNLSLYLIQKFDRLALWGNLTILELHYAETQENKNENKKKIKMRYDGEKNQQKNEKKNEEKC